MNNKILASFTKYGLISIIPLLIYLILIIPTFIIYFFTWVLSPIQPENIRDLELNS